MSTSLLDRIADPARARRQLDRLYAQHRKSGRLHTTRQREVTLAQLMLDRAAVARRLAQALRDGTYGFSPATVRRVLLDKERDLFSFAALDRLVHGMVAEVLTEAMEPALSPRLYSYRRGRSPWQAARDAAAFVRAHRAACPDVRQRGLYVLRADVAAYGDSIPFAAWSPLWPELAEVLGIGVHDPAWPLLYAVMRPDIGGGFGGDSNGDSGGNDSGGVHSGDNDGSNDSSGDNDGSNDSSGDNGSNSNKRAWATVCVGVATGSPVATALANLYLAPLDHQLARVPGGFYARYGDDLMFAHPDAATARVALDDIRSILAARHLVLNEHKLECLYVTGAGRASADWPEARGTTAVRYLGCRIDATGTVGLPTAKCRAFLADLRARIQRTAALLHAAPCTDDERGRTLCAVVNAALDPRSPLASPFAAILTGAVTDRRQLAQLDYWLARAVIGALTGIRGVRGFRQIPYRRLRRDWGLRSLVAERNDYGTRRRARTA